MCYIFGSLPSIEILKKWDSYQAFLSMWKSNYLGGIKEYTVKLLDGCEFSNKVYFGENFSMAAK